MADGKLSDREYRLFELYIAENRPFFGFFQTPANREGIRETSQYKEFLKERPFARVTERTRQILEPTGGLLPRAVAAPPTPRERVTERVQRGVSTRAAERQAADVGLGGRGLGVEIPRRPTEPPPSGFRWGWDNELNRWIPKFVGLSAQQQAQQELAQRELGLTETEARRRQQQFLAGEERAGEQFAFQQEEAAAQRALEQQQFGFQQQQFEAQQQQYTQQRAQSQAQLQFQQEQAQLAAQEQERQYRSQLAANPINWLQYSAYTGEQPVIQPWMIPLGFQNTGGTVAPQGLQAGQPQPQLQAGQPIPGFQAQAGQQAPQAPQTFANLPQLTTPSAQLQARWGPTAQAQFLGYRQARTGAAPQESQFRLASGRAPTGRVGGFSRFR